VYQENGLYTYFVDRYVTERDRRFAVDKEVEFKDSQLYHTLKHFKPIAYGKSDLWTI